MKNKKTPATPAPKTYLPQEQRKTEILNAAGRMFCQYGYDGASLDKIAREAGVSKTLIVSYFDSKENVVKQYLHRLMQTMMETIRQASEDNPRNVRGLLDALFAFTKAQRPEMRFLLTIICTPALESFSRGIIDDYYAEINHYMLPVIASRAKPEMLRTMVYTYFSLLMAYVLGGNEENFHLAERDWYTHYLGEEDPPG